MLKWRPRMPQASDTSFAPQSAFAPQTPCHPERSEGPRSEMARLYSKIPRCARDDMNRRARGLFPNQVAPLLSLCAVLMMGHFARADDVVIDHAAVERLAAPLVEHGWCEGLVVGVLD